MGFDALTKCNHLVTFYRVISLEFPRIKDLREDHDKSQQQMANLMHVHRNVYSRYERGEREPPAWFILKLAEYYHVSTDYIFGLTNDPRPPKRK